VGENEIGKIKFCIYFFSIDLFFLNFLEIYFVAQSTMEKKVTQKTYLLKGVDKEIQIILRLFLVIAMCCQGSSSQMKSITQPPALLAGWKGSLGTCSR
jgi:hypothetical protein